MERSQARKTEDRDERRNLIFFPIGTVGRDMMVSLVAGFLQSFVFFAHTLTGPQVTAILTIMVAARAFDALNDPLMGCIIEKTRSRFGKFKPWLCVGILLSSLVVYLAFNTSLQGWPFVIFFGIIYFLYSIAFTMHDIAYWGMIPSLTSDADRRNRYTSRTVLFAGIGGVLASVLIPVLTTGDLAIGGNALTAYGRVALIIAVLAPLFLAFTVFGVKEKKAPDRRREEKVSVKAILSTVGRNRQLLWISLAFLLQQISSGLVVAGFGQTYIYIKFGYNGAYYSLCQALGLSVTGFLMIFYPKLSRLMPRKKMMSVMMTAALVGYVVIYLSGFFTGTASFTLLTIGYMLSNFGQYGFYLIMMISIMNTVEYNQYLFGVRNESIVASLRPMLTKLSSAVNIGIVMLTYMAAGILRYTNGIADLEQAASLGAISAAARTQEITALLSGVGPKQSASLLAAMSALPCILMFASYLVYRRKYILDEEEYERIVKEIEKRNA